MKNDYDCFASDVDDYGCSSYKELLRQQLLSVGCYQFGDFWSDGIADDSRGSYNLLRGGALMITSLKIKKYIRSANRVAKTINASIAEDELWRGRFVMRQKKFQYFQYDDKSGLHVTFWYEFEDLKTGQKKIYLFNNLEMDFNEPFKSHVWWTMNSFIVDYCDVWREDGKEVIYADKTVYRRK